MVNEKVYITDLVAEVIKLLSVHIRIKQNVYLIEQSAPNLPTLILSDYQRMK
jgi:hypothetical protein